MRILIDQKEKVIDGQTFILSKIPATIARKLMFLYVPSSIPFLKLGDYKVSEECMYTTLSYVAVPNVNNLEPITLESQILIDSHIKSAVTLAKVEAAMVEYNFGFFPIGSSLDGLSDCFQNIRQWITKTVTASLEQLLAVSTPSSMN